MSKLDDDIARQSAALTLSRLRAQQQKEALRRGARSFCKKPTTLLAALLAGAVAARVWPARGSQTEPSAAEGGVSAITDNILTTLRIVLVSLAPALIRRAFEPL